MDSIKGLIDMSKRLDLAPVIACHDDRDVTAAEEIFPEESIFFSNYVDDFFDFYRRSMLVIGSRLHASILAAGLGKPFININLDVRGRGFSETFGLSEWNLDMGNPHLVDRVEERVRTILSGDLSVFEAFSAVRTRYRKRYFDFMDSVARSIKSSMESDG
jgi:polysaccharide pyruvyl transferase WcaK-like protein